MLVKWTLKDVAELVQGKLQGDEQIVVSEPCTDTRKINAGDLYVALSGERFDGHDFVEQAMKAGAAAVLVERKISASIAHIQVRNSLVALGTLAGANRDAFVGPIVAITGSAGKTSTKQLMHSVLSQQFNTLMTQGNLNNHIGAPLTLLSLKPEHQAAVIELGASGLGEIAYTAQWVKPLVGIITNAAEAHIQGFGSLEGVVQTKGELLDFIQDQGCAVLNRDDAHFYAWEERARKRGLAIRSYGLHPDAFVRAEHLSCDLNGSRFQLCVGDENVAVSLPLLGEHNVRNALAVTAAALFLGLTLEQVSQGLNAAMAVAGRLQWLEGANGQRILDDAYNANPASVKAAIDVLKHAQNSWLVLGEMAELGASELIMHTEVGRYAREQGIQHVMSVGECCKHTTEAFGSGAHWFASKEDLVRYLQQHTNHQDVILVKGSRSAGMDQVVAALQTQFKEQ